MCRTASVDPFRLVGRVGWCVSALSFLLLLRLEGEQGTVMSMSVCLCVCPRAYLFQIFAHVIVIYGWPWPKCMTVARFSSGARRYTLGLCRPTSSFIDTMFAHNRRILNTTQQRATPAGAESDLYDCIVLRSHLLCVLYRLTT